MIENIRNFTTKNVIFTVMNEYINRKIVRKLKMAIITNEQITKYMENPPPLQEDIPATKRVVATYPINDFTDEILVYYVVNFKDIPMLSIFDLEWFDVTSAYKHKDYQKMMVAYNTLIVDVHLSIDIVKRLSDDKFTITDLIETIQAIDTNPTFSLDRRNFRRKMLDRNIIEALEETTTKNTRNPANLYRFTDSEYTLSIWK